MIVLLTEWPEFADIDLVKVADRAVGRVIVDGRNVLDPAAVAAAGFPLVPLGRPAG